AKLSPERIAVLILSMAGRSRPTSISLASSSSASLSRAPAFINKARSRVKMVTSSGRGRDSENDHPAAPRSRAVSIATSPRYSMRCDTSARLAAEIDPDTISPFWVSARYRKFGISSPHAGYAQDLGCRCHAGPALGETVVDHGRHSITNGHFVDRRPIGFRVNQPANLFVDLQDFVDTTAAAIPDAAAALAADRFENGVAEREADGRIAGIHVKVRCRQFPTDLASVAQLANQSLGD